MSIFQFKHKCKLIAKYLHTKTMENLPINVKCSERLSRLIRPVHYELVLKPDMDTGNFEGNVKIDVMVKEENHHVNVHTNFLNINSVNVYKDDVEVPVSKYIEEKQLEQLSIKFVNSIAPGSYRIRIDFDGDLTRNIVGLYLSRLKDNRTMVASKFQPTYARQAFPCFDEPDFKATYDISLVKPIAYTALSNMNELSKTVDTGTNMETVKFATSVPMSTYLACFVICDFDYKEVEINSQGVGNNFKLRSFAQKGETHKIDFALDIGKRATEFYIQYYEVPFPLPKLDMIAIPDYVSGATEHWGLITYRETSFLVDEVTASSKNKISVANTIAHELAHMWFGNLVTMKWWDEVWLNEGFASYMQVKALSSIEPSWTMLDQFLPKTLHPVLVVDAKLTSHPIVQTVETPDQITAIFDSISYNKGASVLGMLEGFTGEENFRRGVSDYLKKYKFGNTVTQDLLLSLEPYFKVDNPNLNLTYIMDTWTRQMGFPLVSVGTDGHTYTITQKRFMLDDSPQPDDNNPYKYRWFIPITYKTNKGQKQEMLWFPDTSNQVQLTLSDEVEWLKINNNQIGYYRVNYTVDMWYKLIEALKNKSVELTISDRSHLLNDVFALAEAQEVPYSLALDLSTYLVTEEDYVPWDTAYKIFVDLSDRLLNTKAYDDLQKYIQKLVTPIYEKQSWEQSTNMSVMEGLVRTRVLSLAARCGAAGARARARSLFARWLRAPAAFRLEPDLRDFVYYYGMQSATLEEWEQVWQIYLQENDVQEQAKLRQALAAPRDANILSRYLRLAWDESNVRSQDYLSVVGDVGANPAGAALAWELVRARWPQLAARYSLNSRYLGNLVPLLTKHFNTDEQIREMEEFFAQYSEAGAGESGRRRALERAALNARWSRLHAKTVASWLHQHTHL